MKEIIITLLISMSIFAQKNEKPNSTQVRTEIWLKQFKEIQSDSEKITMTISPLSMRGVNRKRGCY